MDYRAMVRILRPSPESGKKTLNSLPTRKVLGGRTLKLGKRDCSHQDGVKGSKKKKKDGHHHRGVYCVWSWNGCGQQTRGGMGGGVPSRGGCGDVGRSVLASRGTKRTDVLSEPTSLRETSPLKLVAKIRGDLEKQPHFIERCQQHKRW